MKTRSDSSISTTLTLFVLAGCASGSGTEGGNERVNVASLVSAPKSGFGALGECGDSAARTVVHVVVDATSLSTPGRAPALRTITVRVAGDGVPSHHTYPIGDQLADGRTSFPYYPGITHGRVVIRVGVNDAAGTELSWATRQVEVEIGRDTSELLTLGAKDDGRVAGLFVYGCVPKHGQTTVRAIADGKGLSPENRARARSVDLRVDDNGNKIKVSSRIASLDVPQHQLDYTVADNNGREIKVETPTSGGSYRLLGCEDKRGAGRLKVEAQIADAEGGALAADVARVSAGDKGKEIKVETPASGGSY